MKVKITFEFGDNDIPSEIIVEEFTKLEDLNKFVEEAELLKKIDKFDFSFQEIRTILGSFDEAVYWHTIWPYHEHYGPAHITYIKKV